MANFGVYPLVIEHGNSQFSVDIYLYMTSQLMQKVHAMFFFDITANPEVDIYIYIIYILYIYIILYYIILYIYIYYIILYIHTFFFYIQAMVMAFTFDLFRSLADVAGISVAFWDSAACHTSGVFLSITRQMLDM